MMQSDSKKNIVGEFISTEEAGALLEKADSESSLRLGLLSLHHVHCDVRGGIVLVQGGNGEFAIVSQPS